MTSIPANPQMFGPNRPEDISSIQERIQNKIDSGELDIEKFKARVESRFGEDAAAEVFGEDGSIDFERLRELRQEKRAEMLVAKDAEELLEDDDDATDDLLNILV